MAEDPLTKLPNLPPIKEGALDILFNFLHRCDALGNFLRIKLFHFRFLQRNLFATRKSLG